MPFPTTGIIDNFNRADEGPPPSSNWTDLANGLKVVSNQVDGTTDGVNWSCWNVATFGPDCEAYMTMTERTTEGVGLTIRGTTLNVSTIDGYLMHYNDGTGKLEVNRCDNGSFTRLGAQVNWIASAGDKLGAECIGSTLKTLIHDGSWTEKVSRSDGTYGSAGYIGWRPLKTFASDDFSGGTISDGENFVRTISDSVGLADAESLVKEIYRTFNESMGVLDVNSKIWDSIRVLTESLGIADDVTRLVIYLRTETDDIGLVDSMERVSLALRNIDDSMGITDEESAQLGALLQAVWAFVLMRQTHK